MTKLNINFMHNLHTLHVISSRNSKRKFYTICKVIYKSSYNLHYDDFRKILPPTYVEGFHDLEAVREMEYRLFGKTGLMVSKLSLGGAPLGCHYDEYDEAEAIKTIRQAIRQGINYIDTAPWYGQGQSEAVLGKALKGIPRQAYYIATKVGRYIINNECVFDFSMDKTRKSFKNSLELLGLDYVDVIQVHDIEFAPTLDIIISQTLPELSRQVTDGKARHIGITGLPVSVLKECIEKSNINIACVLTYTQLTLINDTLLQYIPFFKKHNIGIINAAVTCMGLLTNDGPQNWHPVTEDVKKTCSEAVRYCKDHNVELGNLAVWYSMQFPDITTNLIGMRDEKILNMNLKILREDITKDEEKLLHEIQKKYLSTIKNKTWEGI